MSVPSSCWMKPYPLLLLNHFTLPVGTVLSFSFRSRRWNARAARALGAGQKKRPQETDFPVDPADSRRDHDSRKQRLHGRNCRVGAGSSQLDFWIARRIGGRTEQVSLAFAERLDLALHAAQQHERPFAVAAFDLDRGEAQLALEALQRVEVVLDPVPERPRQLVELSFEL